MKTNLQDYIAIYKAIEPTICNQIINDFNEGQWSKHSYSNPITKESTTYEDDLDVTYQDKYMDYLNNKIKDCINDYLINVVPMPFQLQEVSTIRFNRYQVNTNMKFHHDHIHTLFDGERKGIPTLTCLIMLNDEFTGGEFMMWEDKVIKVEKGDALVFPSIFLYPHKVLPVTSGVRYSCVTWAW